MANDTQNAHGLSECKGILTFTGKQIKLPLNCGTYTPKTTINIEDNLRVNPH